VVLALVSAACGGDAGEDQADATPTGAAAAVPESDGPEPDVPEPDVPEPDTSESGLRDFSAVSPIIESFVEDKGLNGAGLVVVSRDDGVLYEDYWGEFGEDRISLIASSSKMIVAGVLLRLAEDGLLDLDAPVADVVAWGDANPEITPAQLISNSSGLVGLLPDPAYGPYVCQFLSDATLQECAASVFSTADDDADVVAPDTEFRYGGAQWQVAGAVAEAASGKSWNELVDEIYVVPCGLTSLGFNNHFTQIGTDGFDYPSEFDSDPAVLADTDNPNIEGGAFITAGDYGKLLLMHLRGGRCGDNQVLSAESLARAHRDRIADRYDGDAWSADLGYGMGWWIDRQTGLIRDPGAYGAVPWLDLEDGYGAYLVIEADTATGGDLVGLLYDVVETAVKGG